ncbi:MAG: hypothetical protein IPF92_30035 [Myxococcales bacterium]|nr:hypothetical protein [Myxococcales bacterium]
MPVPLFVVQFVHTAPGVPGAPVHTLTSSSALVAVRRIGLRMTPDARSVRVATGSGRSATVYQGPPEGAI